MAGRHREGKMMVQEVRLKKQSRSRVLSFFARQREEDDHGPEDGPRHNADLKGSELSIPLPFEGEGGGESHNSIDSILPTKGKMEA